MGEAGNVPVLQARGITKEFPGVIANEDVDFALNQGEIHCLLGENGAGKSTLMNVLFGLYQPTRGEILVRGQSVSFSSSADAIALGIGMVHQHFQLIPVFTVAENVVLGDEITNGPLLDMTTARARIVEIAERYGLDVDPDALVGDLSVGEQQRVELVKALFREAEILILDEPTAVLTPGEVDEFFEVVKSLVDKGKSIVFITHKLREVLAVADRITVLRNGRTVGSADPKESTAQTLANLMVGRDVTFEVDKKPAEVGRPRLEIHNLVVTDERGLVACDDVNLTVRAGEIYGVAGVQGNGQRELVEAVTGMRHADSGTVQVDGVDITRANPREVFGLGVGHVPEDRNRHGLVGAFSIADNLVLNSYHRPPFRKGFVRQTAAIDQNATELIERYDVRTPGIDVAVSTLSGGNQQKVIIARELAGDDAVLIVAQPTRGLDVGSIEFIHSRIVEMRDNGAAVLLVSAELDEILSLSDRIGVLYRGKLAGEYDRADTDREQLGLVMAGGAGT
ncbi:MAG TPA: ABC transporter ATP-binding protein [Acidimicrobiales bacterium]|nr:ABC transporter ATP-binding protein [Acidimicrobiales bacterium]